MNKKYYYLAAIRDFKNHNEVMRKIPGEYLLYHDAFRNAIEILKTTEHVVSIIIYSNKGTVINLKKDTCKERGQL